MDCEGGIQQEMVVCMPWM